jgi:hypothetical protein
MNTIITAGENLGAPIYDYMSVKAEPGRVGKVACHTREQIFTLQFPNCAEQTFHRRELDHATDAEVLKVCDALPI